MSLFSLLKANMRLWEKKSLEFSSYGFNYEKIDMNDILKCFFAFTIKNDTISFMKAFLKHSKAFLK